MGNPDPRVPLMNLWTVQERMDSLQQFLSEAVKNNITIGKDEMNKVSGEISTAIQQIIVNGAALLACSQSVQKASDPLDLIIQTKSTNQSSECASSKANEINDADYEIIEMDAVELLAEHVHFCEICGKGFKRDANLRMHMRAHGNQFKTLEALAKPADKGNNLSSLAADETGERKRRRFSCPYEGCNRNKKHKKFTPLKSVICVRNHFKRSHCPKMYSCNRCNKKCFSVVADLKSHLKHCGESRLRCSCGTSFSRKDKLFGHMALFEGHMPAVVAAADEDKIKIEAATVEEDESNGNFVNNEFPEGFLDGFGSVDAGYELRYLLGSPDNISGWDNGFQDSFASGSS